MTKASDIPKGFPIQLNTDSMNWFFPGLKDHYGSNKTMEITYKLVDIDNFGSYEGKDLSVNSTVQVSFWVFTDLKTKEAAVNITLTDLMTEASLKVLTDTTLRA